MPGPSPEIALRPYPAKERLSWALLGATLAILLLALQANALGSYSSILQVGEGSALAPYISERLPDVHLTSGVGNDGSIYFAIGSDLAGSAVPELIPSPGLRYRRIAFPWLSSLGGLLHGHSLLVGMMSVVVASAAASMASLMAIAAHWNVQRSVAFGLVANFGWILGIQLLTPDPLGIALMLAGISAAVRNRMTSATVLLAAAALTKEPYYAAALAIAVWLWANRRPGWAVACTIAPVIPVAIWALVLKGRMAGFNTAAHIDWPGLGIVKGMTFWEGAPTKDHFYSALALVGLALAIAGGFATKVTLLRWLAWGWAGVGLVSSDWIWKFGNASVRVLAPCLLFGFFCFATSRFGRTEPKRTLDFPVNLDGT